jgi:hypothetical protein
LSWLELDDRILEHPKFIRAVKLGGSEAIHLWLGIRAYCGQNLTDGKVPRDMLDEVRGPSNEKKRELALGALVTVGLIRDNGNQGVAMHDYLQWSSSREDVLERRGKARERKARSRGPSQRDSERPGGGTPTGVTPIVTNPHGRDPSAPPPSSTPTTTGSEAASAPTLAERARKILDNPFDGEFQQPARWPEVILAGKCLSRGLEIRFRNSVNSDTDLKTVLQIYADGYTAEQVEQLGKLANTSEYFQKKGTWGPAAFTIAVVRRLFGEPTQTVTKMQLPEGVKFGAEGLR